MDDNKLCSDDGTSPHGQAYQPWLTSQQAADYLQISLGHLRNLVSRCEIPFCRRKRIVRFKTHELDQWLSRDRCNGRRPPGPVRPSQPQQPKEHPDA